MGLDPSKFELGKCYVAKGESSDGTNHVSLIFRFLGNQPQRKIKVEIIHILDYDEYAPEVGEIGEVSYEELRNEKVEFRDLTKAEEVLYGRKSV